jgi:hypothetical protein
MCITGDPFQALPLPPVNTAMASVYIPLTHGKRIGKVDKEYDNQAKCGRMKRQALQE